MHVLEFFGDGCALCERYLESIKTAKCDDCSVEVYHKGHPKWDAKVAEYRVDLLPTLVVDQEVRVEGHQDTRWLCQGPWSVALRAKFPVLATRGAALVA